MRLQYRKANHLIIFLSFEMSSSVTIDSLLETRLSVTWYIFWSPSGPIFIPLCNHWEIRRNIYILCFFRAKLLWVKALKIKCALYFLKKFILSSMLLSDPFDQGTKKVQSSLFFALLSPISVIVWHDFRCMQKYSLNNRQSHHIFSYPWHWELPVSSPEVYAANHDPAAGSYFSQDLLRCYVEFTCREISLIIRKWGCHLKQAVLVENGCWKIFFPGIHCTVSLSWMKTWLSAGISISD